EIGGNRAAGGIDQILVDARLGGPGGERRIVLGLLLADPVVRQGVLHRAVVAGPERVGIEDRPGVGTMTARALCIAGGGSPALALRRREQIGVQLELGAVV